MMSFGNHSEISVEGKDEFNLSFNSDDICESNRILNNYLEESNDSISSPGDTFIGNLTTILINSIMYFNN